jgi:hypothetical protein
LYLLVLGNRCGNQPVRPVPTLLHSGGFVQRCGVS